FRKLHCPFRRTLNLPTTAGDPTEVGLEDLTEVHSSRNTERVEHNVKRRSVREERHVLDRKDLGNNTLVSVAACKLVTSGDLALLSDVDHDATVDTRAELVVAVFRVE